jgi:ABC-type glycerol-3-phosphate transport system substrate-binding protein
MQYRSRRAVRVLPLVLVAACSLAACSSGGGKSQAGKSVVLLANTNSNHPQSFWENAVKPFEDKTGIKVTVRGPSGTSSVQETLTQELASGSPPDVVEDGEYTPAVQSVLATFDKESWAKSTAMMKSLMVNGHIYTVSTGVQPQSLLFYNKAAFTKAGIAGCPTTVDDVTADLAKLAAAGYQPWQSGGDSFVAGFQIEAIANPALFASDPTWYLDRTAGKVKFTTSPYAGFLTSYASWIKSKYIDPNSLGVTFNQATANFLAGKSGMYLMGAWFVATADQAKASDQVGTCPVPVLAASDTYPPAMVASPAAPYMVMKASKSLDASMQLVQFLVTDKTAATAVLKADGNFNPSFPYTESSLGTSVSAVVAKSPSYVVPSSGLGDEQPPTGFDAENYKAVDELFVGKSASQVASDLDQWWDENK